MIASPAPPQPVTLPLRQRLQNGAAHGMRVGVVAAFCYWSSERFGLHEGYWSAISSIVVMQGDLNATVNASRDRLIGTAIGGVFGWLTGSIWGGEIWVYGLAIALAMFVCGTFGLDAAGRLTGVTMSVITLIPRAGPLWETALHRFIGVSYGVVVALGVWVLITRLMRRIGSSPSPGASPT